MSEIFPMRTIAIQIFRCKDEKLMSRMNRWYDKTFVPAARLIPGVAGVYRYIARDFDDGEAGMFRHYLEEPVRYLTIYQIHTNDLDRTLKAIRETTETLTMEAIEPLEFTLWDFCCRRQSLLPCYREIPTHLPDGMPEMFMLIPNINYEKDMMEMDDWWLYTHAHDIMEIPGYVQASRYHNITPGVQDGDVRGLNIYEIDSDDPVNHPLMENMTGDVGRAKEGRFLDVGNPEPRSPLYLCGLFQHWDIMSGI